MDFNSTDAETILGHLKDDRALFGNAIATLVGCENFDNRIPSGLMSLLDFFNRHRQAIHAGTVSGADLHAEFLVWLRHRHED